MNSKRLPYLDYLRVISIFFVVMIHVSSQNWYGTDVNSFEWQTFNFYDCISRWSVPVFVMISGVLFLNRDIDIKTIYRKYVLNILYLFFIWSIFYLIIDGNSFGIKNILRGKYHMWFLFMIIGIYMSYPILKEVVKNKCILKYFLLLAFFVSFLIPTFQKIAQDFFHKSTTVSLIFEKINVLNIKLVLGYSGYFVLGYYLNSVNFTKKQRILIYVLGILGLLSTIILQILLVQKIQTRTGRYYDNFTVGILLISIAIFIGAKYENFSSKRCKIIEKMSNYTLCVYLLHVCILEILKKMGLNTLSFNPLISTITLSLCVFCISMFIAWMFHNTPILKKIYWLMIRR